MRHRGRTFGPAWALSLVVAFAVTAAWVSGCGAAGVPGRPRLVLGTRPRSFASLVAVADKGGFFAKNDVNVEVRKYASALDALDDLLARRIDAVVCSDFALANASLETTAFRVLCEVSLSTDHQVMVLKDSGIGSPADLKGKRVGLRLGTQQEFVFLRVLVSEGIDPASVSIVSIPTSQTARALVDRKVDAVVINVEMGAELNAEDATVLGSRAERLGGAELAATYSMLSVTPELATTRQAEATALMRALVDAQAWAERNPGQAVEIARAFIGSRTAMASGWPSTALYVRLPEQAVSRIEEEAKWLARRRGRAVPPPVRGLFCPDPLAAVDPALVTVIPE